MHAFNVLLTPCSPARHLPSHAVSQRDSRRCHHPRALATHSE